MNKKILKKLGALALILALAAGSLAGCGDKKDSSNAKQQEEKKDQSKDKEKDEKTEANNDAEKGDSEESSSQSGESPVKVDGDYMVCNGTIRIYYEKDLEGSDSIPEGSAQYVVLLQLPDDADVPGISGGSGESVTKKTNMIVLDRISSPQVDGWDRYDGRTETIKASINDTVYPSDASVPLGKPQCNNYEIVR